MNNTQEALIHLLTCAFGKRTNSTVDEIVNWRDVKTLSISQEVFGIALDGYQIIHHSLGEFSLSSYDLIEWIGQVRFLENNYETHLISSAHLADLYDDNNILTFVLKGFSISQCYPKPSHRYSCDLDCCLIAKDSNTNWNAFDLGNKIVEAKGLVVNRDYYKHSVFIFEDVLVENHRYCCSVKRGKRTVDLEAYLQELLCKEPSHYLENSKLALPSLMFQALFLVEHACGHFLYGKMNLKNICDWAMFRRYYRNQLDWIEFDSLCERFSLKNFADTLGHLSDCILGYCEYQELSNLDQRVLEDTLNTLEMPKNKMKQRFFKAMLVLRNGWKFRYFSKDSMIKELIHSFFAYLFYSDVD